MAYEVIHQRSGCIGCGACVQVCPDYWSMASDGKSSLKNAKSIGKGVEHAEFTKGLACNKKAMNVCPVQVIIIKLL